MPGLSSELYSRCRVTLLKCSELDSDASLRAVFVADELYPFRSGLPEAANKKERVDACLGFLLSQRLSDGRPVMSLFLAALRDRYRPGNALRDELEALSDTVRSAMTQSVARRIQLILEGETSDFTDERRDTLLNVLANVLQVELSDVRILRVQPGSIRVVVEVPEQALTRLNSLSRNDISLLVSIGVQTIEGDAIRTMDFRIENLLTKAQAFLEKDSLDEAVKLLRSVRLDHPDRKDVGQLYLEAIYRKGVRAYVKDYNLPLARRVFQEVVDIAPPYKDAARLLHEVEQRLERERLRPVPRLEWLPRQVRKALRYPIWQSIGAIVAIVALAVAVGTWLWPDVRIFPFPATPTPMPAPTATIPPILRGSANLRDGPGVEFRIAGEGQEGNRVEIVAQFTNCRGELWYVIRFPPGAGAERWVLAELITGTIPYSMPTATPVPDEYTILALMDAEKRAVLGEDISLIELIFAPEAAKVDGQAGQAWSARERYIETFDEERHEEINHTNIHVTFEGPDRAAVTNNSQGAFVIEATGERIEYDNYQEDRWTFKKNDAGCWQITSLTYNAQVPCAQASDEETIRAVIDAEAQAVLAEDIDLIRDIFAPDAVITDGETGNSRSDPIERYREKFEREVHYEIIHENFRISIIGREATVINDCRGGWAFESAPAQRMTYHNYGSDRWTLRKTDNGCWRIVDFTYNAR